MTAPAISGVIDALIEKVEAITPTIDEGRRFRRSDERAPPTTRNGKRLFDVEFEGHPRDLSNEAAGRQTVGQAERIARLSVDVGYPVGRSEKDLETTIAVDSELLLRALGRSANWAGTSIQRAVARTTVDRSEIEAVEDAPGLIHLRVAVDVQYVDVE